MLACEVIRFVNATRDLKDFRVAGRVGKHF